MRYCQLKAGLLNGDDELFICLGYIVTIALIKLVRQKRAARISSNMFFKSTFCSCSSSSLFLIMVLT